MSYHAGISGLTASPSSAAMMSASSTSDSLDEDEEGRDTDEGERLGERDTDVHEDRQAALELGLAGDRLDGLADDDAHADSGADRGEAVADRRDVAVDLGENGVCVHEGCFLPCWMNRAGARSSALPPARAGGRQRSR